MVALIDGYSRLITCLRAADNNLSETAVLETLKIGTLEFCPENRFTLELLINWSRNEQNTSLVTPPKSRASSLDT